MSISINQIDELRERTSVNYTDAKEALESCNGDMLEAVVYLEKNKKARASKTECRGASSSDKISALLKKGSNTRCIMHKKEKVVLNISMNMLVLFGLITLPVIQFVLIGFLIALLTDHRFRLESSANDTDKINKTLDKVCDTVDQAKEKFSNSVTVSSNDTIK